MCLIGANFKHGRLRRLRIYFDLEANSKNGRFGRFGRPAKPSAPRGGRFGRLWRDSHFHLRNSENKVNSAHAALSQFNLCFQAPDSSSYISTGNLVFTRINLKPFWRILCLIGHCVSIPVKSTVFRIW